jgi:uncharacterized protein YceK
LFNLLQNNNLTTQFKLLALKQGGLMKNLVIAVSVIICAASLLSGCASKTGSCASNTTEGAAYAATGAASMNASETHKTISYNRMPSLKPYSSR